MTTTSRRFALVCSALLAASMLAPAQDTPPPQPGQLPQSGKGVQDLSKTVSAPSFTVRDKFEYRVVQSFGARGFIGALFGAAIGQADNSPHEWGQGVQGFAERYGSGVAGNISRQTFAFVLESSFHEDPRYFPLSKDRTMNERAANALKQVITCKTDSGKSEFAWARVISQFGAGQFDNIWQPRSSGTVTDGFKRGLIGLGADAAYNFMQEFLPFTRPRSIRHRQ